MSNRFIDALVQNYGFKKTTEARMPTVDYVYPNFTADGNTESFRFSESLRAELKSRRGLVYSALAGKDLAWSYEDSIMREVAGIAPRLGIREQLNKEGNFIYHNPLLFLGVEKTGCPQSAIAYVAKPLVTWDMAWFELTDKELSETRNLLQTLADQKPYRTVMQRIFSTKQNGGQK
ncbi:hypothetical protein KA107_02680 [Candidatus Pacearchaeota archaeon]|nr:hypothetical protein [Candidatus Pacearchaeota archaeon]